jgi:hypothetical protein
MGNALNRGPGPRPPVGQETTDGFLLPSEFQTRPPLGSKVTVKFPTGEVEVGTIIPNEDDLSTPHFGAGSFTIRLKDGPLETWDHPNILIRIDQVGFLERRGGKRYKKSKRRGKKKRNTRKH